MIMVDLDGTLLKNDKTISDYSLNILNKLRKKYKIVINTARGFRESKEYINIIKPDYAVLNSGALIFDKDKNVVYQKGFTDKEARNIINALRKYVSKIMVESERGPISDIKGVDFEDLIPNYDDFTEEFKMVNAIVFDSEGREDVLKIASNCGEYLTRFLDSNFYQISRTTKGTGTRVLKNMFESEEIIAFGDDTGDIEMFKEATRPIKMKNSNVVLKELNIEETEYTNEEDGVCRHLEYLLEEEC